MLRVIFSVGVRIPGEGMGNHAYYLVAGLERHKMLARAFVMQSAGTGLDQAKIKTGYVTERIAYRLVRYTHFDQYVLRDNLFDYWVARQLSKADIFYGWTHHALWSLKKAKRLGMVTVLERANSHPHTYIRLLEAEYQKRGIGTGAYHPLTLKKHLKEIQETDYIAVTSAFTKQSLLENGIAESRILLTPLGVDTQHFAPAPKRPDRFCVVYVGQLCLRKGVQYLLEAWSKLQLPYAQLFLVGDVVTDLQGILLEHLKRSDTITVLPHTPDPVSTYQQASVCILPTLEDGFGLVVLEAMSCGVPVIITDHTGAKDCVRPNQDSFLIPPYSADAIADTLRFCYEHQDQLVAMGCHARQQAEQFPWTRYQDGIVTHLKTIAE